METGAEATTRSPQPGMPTSTFAGTGWALGIGARSRAGLGDAPAVDDAYREVTDHLSGHPPPLRRMAPPGAPPARRPPSRQFGSSCAARFALTSRGDGPDHKFRRGVVVENPACCRVNGR